MGTKLQESTHGCFFKALENEPMFVLLGRDPEAPNLVIEWSIKRLQDILNQKRPIEDLLNVSESLLLANSMIEWKKLNEGKWRNTKKDK